MSTEASFRFERGVDPDGTLWAAHRVAYFIQKLAGGTILSGYLDVYPNPIIRPPVQVRTEKVNSLLGTELTGSQMESYLKRLGIEINDHTKTTMTAVPPSWRWDLEREVDMAEEVARVHGFQNIPISMPITRSAPDPTRENQRKINKVKGLANAVRLHRSDHYVFRLKGSRVRIRC